MLASRHHAAHGGVLPGGSGWQADTPRAWLQMGHVGSSLSRMVWQQLRQ